MEQLSDKDSGMGASYNNFSVSSHHLPEKVSQPKSLTNYTSDLNSGLIN